ncbi:hypothetical protein [Leptospira meyeri]|uniref:hypothetical protein n=1 Tax=Leptospira meyeri TaxID=29508 RepID=UPI000C2996D0|nr:hypothetical protein [Leptospira meyeri]PJZ79273.1 hypothetical protein CH359_19055 [Leptospira meyeri]PJZ95107.1 hypothetical protein CH358_19015 [Leptospira meyeri]
MEEFARIIKIVAVIQGVFLGLILFFRKKNTTSNKIFALLTVIVSVRMLTDFFRTPNWTVTYYYMFLLNLASYPICGPLIYFYTLSITESLQKPISSQIDFNEYEIHDLGLVFRTFSRDIYEQAVEKNIIKAQ